MADRTIKILTPATSKALISLDELKAGLGVPHDRHVARRAVPDVDQAILDGHRQRLQSHLRLRGRCARRGAAIRRPMRTTGCFSRTGRSRSRSDIGRSADGHRRLIQRLRAGGAVGQADADGRHGPRTSSSAIAAATICPMKRRDDLKAAVMLLVQARMVPLLHRADRRHSQHQPSRSRE